MRILCLDIGTGTQDILLFDSTVEVENCFQLVMPSPTVLVANQVREATRRRIPVLLTGHLMGGGPAAWAALDHVKAGLPVYATPSAALSFDDELDKVAATGIRIVSAEDTPARDAVRVMMGDLDLGAVRRAFAAFGVDLTFDALAVAVFDHGNAPPGVSDRTFRFEFLAERIRATGRLSGFAFMRDEIPPRLTRMLAVAAAAATDAPVMLMDTAPAAVRGALDDDRVAAEPDALVANLGNFHTLAFRFTRGQISGVFEHHTGELTAPQLEEFLRELAAGTLTNAAVFDSQGHGAVLFDTRPQPLNFLAVTGPRRSLLLDSPLRPYFAVPYGDMMLAGAYGLLHAYSDLNPNSTEEIRGALARSRRAAAEQARA